MEQYKRLARELYNKYYDYYSTVYFDFLVEAVQDSMRDLHGITSLEELHEHITENYI